MRPRTKIILSAFTFFLFLATQAIASPSIPTTFSLTATSNAITVSWDAVSDATGYYIYYSTSSSITSTTTKKRVTNSEAGLTSPISAGDDATFVLNAAASVTIDSGTTYYIAISSFDDDDESSRATAKSITTDEASAPGTPQNLGLTTRGETSVTFSWQKGNTQDVDSYTVSAEKYTASSDTWATATGITIPSDITQTNTTISGLTGDTRYRFRVKATNAEGTSADSAWLIVDTTQAGNTTDTLAPFAPILVASQHKPVLLDNLKVRLTFDDSKNQGMADLTKYRIHFGTDAANLNETRELDKDAEIIITGLTENSRYTFQVQTLDSSGNASDKSAKSQEILVETTEGLLEDGDGVQGGCFVSSSKEDRISPLMLLLPLVGFLLLGKRAKKARPFLVLFLLMALTPTASEAFEEPMNDNIIAIKGGVFIPSDDAVEKIYDGTDGAVSITYQRHLIWGLHAGLEAGFIRKEGTKRSASGAASGAEVELTLVPVSANLIWDIPVTPEVVLFFGGGVDYWYYKEESETVTVDAKDNDYGVGGYNGRFGVKLFTEDPALFHQMGVLVEGVYSVIDRFGDNTLDLGGWTASAGIFFTY